MISEKSDLALIKQVVTLQKMKTADLEKMWGRFYDHPPEIASRQHVTAKIAYKLQELAYGGVDETTVAKIKACAKKIQTPLDKAKKTKKYKPMVGSKLVKEYNGALLEVLVVQDGFAYNGEVFKSLSAVAKKVTGTNWNGLRFFGVKG